MTRAETLQGGLERSLCKAAKVSPRFQWRLQDGGDTITIGNLSRRAVAVEWRCTCDADGIAGGLGPPSPLELSQSHDFQMLFMEL